MPTYEYACTSCGEHVEVVQSFRDDPLTTCPACGGPLRKVFGSIGVVFKGSGFYKNDSRPASKESTAAKDTAPSTTSESSGDGSKKDASATTKEKTSSSEKSSGDKSPTSSGTSSPEKSKKPAGKSGSSAAAS